MESRSAAYVEEAALFFFSSDKTRKSLRQTSTQLESCDIGAHIAEKVRRAQTGPRQRHGTNTNPHLLLNAHVIRLHT